jgi:Lon protease-like protein
VESPPSFGPRDLRSALASLPLFPLPAVLFPGAMMPLHIFEPRYRAMIRDVLGSHQTLSVVLVTDATKVDAHGHPEIASIAGVGDIIDHAELPSGRFNILLRGRARVHLDELPFVAPYRRARATVLTPPPAEVGASELSSLISAAAAFTARVREREPSFELSLPKDAPAGVLADLCAHQLILDARERQAVLETLDVPSRVRKVAEALTLQRLTLSHDPKDMN